MKALRSIVLAGVIAAGGCAAARPGAGPAASPAPLRPARINHVVFFKLKDPAEAPQLVRDCNELLKAIPGIAAGWAGMRLETDRPEAADDDYDVSFYAGFMSESDYAVYREHPAHMEAATRWGPRLLWLRVHDVLDTEADTGR